MRSINIGKTMALICTGIIGWFLTQAANAQTDPVFSPEATRLCLLEAHKSSPNLSGHHVLDCVGLSAHACFSSAGGDTTIGMMSCLEAELKYWDQRLNEAYAKRLTIAKQEDREVAGLRSTTASLTEALRRMQRAWMSFRDAACLYEQA